MSRVIFMCGPAGSGKSTIARTLERDGMVRLSFDQEAWRRGLRTMPLAEEDRAEIDRVLRERLRDAVTADRDVVLDFSFWSRRMRGTWRSLVLAMGVTPETIYVATDRETCLARVRARALRDGDDYALDPRIAEAYVDHFEPPDEDEGPLTVVRPAR